MLLRQGYSTSLIGKWHLGAPPKFGPLKSGYERFFGFHYGALDYFLHTPNRNEPPDPYEGLYENERPIKVQGYLTDLFADRAIAQIRTHDRGRPFFMSLHFNAPHWPWEGPDQAAVAPTLERLRDYSQGSLKIYGEMVMAMDAAIGRVLAALDETQQAANTIVIFTSDNGGERFSDAWPFIGMKGELLEGGIRVPAIVRWPVSIAPAQKSDQVSASMDWAPTLLSMATGSVPRASLFDGVDISAAMMGGTPTPRTLFWRYRANHQAAVRDGDWKYLRLGKHECLFDLSADVHERAEVQDKHPQAFKRLKAMHAKWNSSMLPYPKKSYSEDPKDNLLDRY